MEFQKVFHLVQFIKKYVKHLYVVGSYRRYEPILNDLDFITMDDLDDVLKNFQKNFQNVEIISKTDKFMHFKILQCIKIDIWRALDKYEYFFLKTLLSLTLKCNIYWKYRASQKGYKLTERGLFKNDERVQVRTKQDLQKLIT